MNRKAGIIIGSVLILGAVGVYLLYQEYLKEVWGVGEITAETKQNKIVIVK